MYFLHPLLFWPKKRNMLFTSLDNAFIWFSLLKMFFPAHLTSPLCSLWEEKQYLERENEIQPKPEVSSSLHHPGVVFRVGGFLPRQRSSEGINMTLTISLHSGLIPTHEDFPLAPPAAIWRNVKDFIVRFLIQTSRWAEKFSSLFF